MASLQTVISTTTNVVWPPKAEVFQTRKLSYRKDDRAMHPMYECPENIWESLTLPTATFPKVLIGFSSD